VGVVEKKKVTTIDVTVAFLCGGVAKKKVVLPSFLCLKRKR